MKKLSRQKLSAPETFSILTIGGLFIITSFFANRYDYLLEEIALFQGFAGIFAYILITIIAVVLAPVSTFPLLPLAVSLWGSFLTALTSIIGWTIGASCAFALARRFGKPLIGKIVSLEKIQRIEKLIPKHNLFTSIVLLRMSLPVDVLSYALGLFSSIPFKLYFLATLIGITPFAFIFSYAVLLPVWLNALFLFLAIITIVIGYKKLQQ